MYFPILRGRQYELLALRECVNKNILSNKIIPIVEPVKISSTYIKTVDSFIDTKKSIAIIRNPQVGSWSKELKESDNAKILEQLNDESVISAFYVTSALSDNINKASTEGKSVDSLLLLCNNPEYISTYEEVIGNKTPRYTVIPDKSDFRRRIKYNRIMCEDHFLKQTRNIDYSNRTSEFFSSDHLYYKSDNYEGFSDYSIVGEEYSETGFAPYAVAIHIVYLDGERNLRIEHFVSDSNDDISDAARKFSEAVEKLVKWNETMNLNTVGIKKFEEAYRNKTFHGLGIIKKYSIMHHLELIGKYLDEVVS